MIKVKRLKLSGFRGILKPQDLNLMQTGRKEPSSFVLYGSNSTGKTSFVDGLEWFLSPNNRIEWLQREEAKEKAYPHQEAKNGDSYVEIEFFDNKGDLDILSKIFNHKRITKPDLSSEEDFEKIYSSFVIKPYLRYLEVIDFVYNRTGVQKYEKLASWMGFEKELDFQQKLVLDIVQTLKNKEDELTKRVELLEEQLNRILNQPTVTEKTILNFSNSILSTYKIKARTTLKDLWSYIPEFDKLKISTSVGMKIGKLTQIENTLNIDFNFDTAFIGKVGKLIAGVEEIKKEKQAISKIDAIELYTKALDLLNKVVDDKTKCPVCGTEWGRQEILTHIKDELELLKKVKEDREKVLRILREVRHLLNIEFAKSEKLKQKYIDTKEVVKKLEYPTLTSYIELLKKFNDVLEGDIFSTKLANFPEEKVKKINEEKDKIIDLIQTEKQKIQPSKKDLELSEDIEKLDQIESKWNEILEAKEKKDFFSTEIKKFMVLASGLIKLIQEGVKSRFNEISERIGKYFDILRNDKDIKDIEIVLNEERGRAAGRSAEIQLSYYNISVKPAYKVLSESLLNSLGLAVYFTCIKQFNDQCKFIVLDDIMNSLDIENRDTMLDLIEKEFSGHQIILFTHDYYWFQKITRRFPQWIRKKIKRWDYTVGPNIDYAETALEEIEELLKDSTKIEMAGFLFGKHVEGLLNELCENTHAELRYRYIKSDPPSMEELFTALYKRFKNKIGKDHPVTQKVINAQKYEPLLRNFTGHPRSNYPASISPTEVRNAAEKWFELEKELCCAACNRYVEYHPTKKSIECRCSNIKLKKLAVKTRQQ